MSVDELAHTVGASPTYMTKLLGRLRRAGIVEARRGRAGGYLVARQASSITLWEVVAALEETAKFDQGLLPLCTNCPLAPTCPIRAALRAAETAVQNQLTKLTVRSLSEMMGHVGAPAFKEPRQAQKVAG